MNPQTSPESKSWTIRYLDTFPVQPGGEVRANEHQTVKFTATRDEAIAYWRSARAAASKNTQVTLYGSGPRVREAWGLAER